MKDVCAVILAAGKGTRMKSDTPKVLHPILGRPMLEYVLGSVEKMGVGSVVVVLGHGSDAVRKVVGERARVVIQEPQLGTGHALQVASAEIPADAQRVLVVSGDQPLLDGGMFEDLLKRHQEAGVPVSVLTAILPWANDLGRVVRNAEGFMERIVEAREAPPEILAIAEVNLGTYCLDAAHMRAHLSDMGLENSQREIYITDLVLLTARAGKRVLPVDARDPYASIGVNSRKELAEVTRVMRSRINERWMLAGVTLVDPESTFIHPDVAIGRDSTILPFTILEGSTRIGEGCTIGPSCRITDSRLGNRVLVQNSVLIEAAIDDDCTVGPFAYLRPGTDLGRHVKVGDFVEIKKSRVEEHSKIPHLSYVGDAHIGSRVNIGAGTITCNYDGKHKHHTEIEDDVHIGSNTNLVAPVRVGRGSSTGAGAVVTKDVPPDTVVVGVPARPLRLPQKTEGAPP